MPDLELISSEEARQIENIVRLTLDQLRNRYSGAAPSLRGQHAKDHACVMGKLKVSDGLAAEKRIGVFANPGQEYQVWIRFSNAAATKGADSPVVSGATTHGSRGMAIKIMGVTGKPLMPLNGALTQDFLMVNHPVFPFANVEDYEAITRILASETPDPNLFFAPARLSTSPEVASRAKRTGLIIKRIQSLSLDAKPPAYQVPPASPVDNQYFGGAPFLFGDDSVMKFSANPRSKVAGDEHNLADPNYLRAALHQRLTAPGAQEVVFDFQVQVRKASDLAGKIDTQIEDATEEWKETDFAPTTVATITIQPQDFETPERVQACESLVFTPWHGIEEHRPLGGINRLRRAVYEASAGFRHIPKEPAHF